MNSYMKIEGEKELTHWEPKKGAQQDRTDNTCAVIMSITTSLFEFGVRAKILKSSPEATTLIFQTPELQKLCDNLCELKKTGFKQY